jgi:transposase
LKTYAGIDLHSSNNYLGIIDGQDKRLFSRRLPNCIGTIVNALEPYRKTLTGIAVESTYNWYWLVDGLEEAGFKLHLTNPSAIQQYEGLKHTDDKWDSFWLAHMLRLGILPEGYIYPKKQRPIRDLLRRRLFFVQKRTSHIQSFQSMFTRYLGGKISSNDIKKLEASNVDQIFPDPYVALAANDHIDTIGFLTAKIKNMEKMILSKSKMRKPFQVLTTTPGIGTVLGLTIMLEIGDIKRFPGAGNYASYCRCVKSDKLSNKKKKGQGNRKNGNKYLAWAYVEAAHLIIRYCPEANRFYQRKMAKTNGALATKALANKLAKAHFYMLRDQLGFKKHKLFAQG